MAGAAPACEAHVRRRAWPVAASHRFAGTCGPRAGQTLHDAVKEKRMKSFAKAVLAAVAAGGLLAGCATYDYGYGYT